MLGKELYTYETTKIEKIKNLIGTFLPLIIFGGLATRVSSYVMSGICICQLKSVPLIQSKSVPLYLFNIFSVSLIL